MIVPAHLELPALHERFSAQVGAAASATPVTPAKVGGSVQVPVAVAEAQVDIADSHSPVAFTAATR